MYIPWKEVGHRFLYKKTHTWTSIWKIAPSPAASSLGRPHLANGTLLCSDLGPTGIFLWENWYADILLDPIVLSVLLPHTSGPRSPSFLTLLQAL